MSITGPELVLVTVMTLAFFAGAWFFVVRPAEKRRR